jgi:hypothetical protein
MRAIVRVFGQRVLQPDATASDYMIMAYLSWLLKEPMVAQREAERALQIAPDVAENSRFLEMLKADAVSASRS